MATFVFKLNGFAPISPRGRKYTMPDAAVARIITAYKAVSPQVPSGPADPVTGIIPSRVMTDAEVVDAMFDGLMTGVINNSHSYAKETVAQIARDAVVRDSAPPVADNT